VSREREARDFEFEADFRMRTIGMIGGMSWESSAIYYWMVNEAVKERLGGHHSAQTLMLAAPAPRAARRVVAASVEHGSRGPEAGRMIRLPTDERSLEPYDVRHIETPDNPHYRATRTDYRLVSAGKTW
jgi:hypothetical protein